MFTDTIALQTIPPPTPPSLEMAKLLLDLISHAWRALPVDAQQLSDCSVMPSGLRRLETISRALGQTTACWRDGRRRHWLFAAELLRESSAQRGMPMLRLDVFEGDDGTLLDSACWVLESPSNWCRWCPGED